MGTPVDVEGAEVAVKLDLGKAAQFATFDSTDNTFRVHQTLLKRRHAGIYKIGVHPQNTVNKMYLDRTFILVVYENFGFEGDSEDTKETDDTDKSNFKPEDDYFYVMDWHGPVYESIKEAPYDEAAPVPYIVDFSLTGVLTIGWDR